MGNVQNFFDVSGSGDFIGLSFKRNLLGVGRYKHSLSVGLQDRNFDTAISNSATGLAIRGISTQVRSRPVSMRYDGSYNWPVSATSLDFYFDFTSNLSFGGHNDDSDYRRVNPNAQSGWKVIRFGGLVTQILPYDFSAVIKLNGQYTRDTLIPGEQFGLGGERSVRGFEERTIAGDRALETSAELWSPPISRLYDLRVLGFIDYGFKNLVKPQSKQLRRDAISSIGVGARWQLRDLVALSVDYGLPLAHAEGEAADRGNSKWHVNLQVRY